jgi:hypothetical protein
MTITTRGRYAVRRSPLPRRLLAVGAGTFALFVVLPLLLGAGG